MIRYVWYLRLTSNCVQLNQFDIRTTFWLKSNCVGHMRFLIDRTYPWPRDNGKQLIQ